MDFFFKAGDGDFINITVYSISEDQQSDTLLSITDIPGPRAYWSRAYLQLPNGTRRLEIRLTRASVPDKSSGIFIDDISVSPCKEYGKLKDSWHGLLWSLYFVFYEGYDISMSCIYGHI